jgi:acyl transferase domain-containing protein/NAD(P)-dependent dehydrogenase (short-subunit alcohol dehydrogenase family)/SAM-dependent methyltransferase/acyl carrier protein
VTDQKTGSSETLSPTKRALLALDRMQAKLDAVERARREPIAIVGMSCRLPGGVEDPEGFWELLRGGVDAITEVPRERWDVDAYYAQEPDAPGKMYTRHGSFLSNIDLFDAAFFGISPREAESMDPQQRLLLEVSWEALERAGIAPDSLAGSQTGVFLGMCGNDYSRLHIGSGDPTRIDAYSGTGVVVSVAAGRLSYVLGLQGPALTLDTACSSSLVAIHHACQSLRSGESDLALAGGVNLILAPEGNIYFSKARMMSPDGRCKTFDASADGYVRGEGCAVVVLKRLSDALARGDQVLAVLRGSAVNHDGHSSGLTVPNVQAQKAVIRGALSAAGVEPHEVGYIEAHGTGTSLGDPLEVRALSAVLGGRSPEQRLLLGSVKTNIGHLEAAAGVAGLLKVVLTMQHGEIPPHLHLRSLNPHISLEELPAAIPTQATPWPGGRRRIAGVSSFGASGTNSHLVVEEAPPRSATEAPGVERPLHVLTLSAKSPEALKALAARFERHLAAHPSESLADVAFTANTGRAHFAHRLAVVASASEQARQRLEAFVSAGAAEGVISGQAKKGSAPGVAFLFTGQGAQYVGMGRGLFESEPTFREALQRCDTLLRPHLDRPLLSVLYPEPGEASLLDETAYTQPALFALEYALSELWRSWGITPSAVIGHSVGEYVAACVAGVFSLEDGLALIARRGRLMQSLPREGGMAAVFADESRVAAAIAPHAHELSIAALNAPSEVVISGSQRALDAVLEALAAEGIRTRRLTVSHAFHSPAMEPILEAFEEAARRVEFRAPTLPLISNLTGQVFAPGQAPDARYFRLHLRQPVRFTQGLDALAAEGCTTFIELGPHPTLLGLVARGGSEDGRRGLPSLRRGRDDWEQLLDSAAELYTRGLPLDWSGFDRHHARSRLTLPTYPFQRQRYWMDEPVVHRPRAVASHPRRHPLLGERLRSPALREVVFESALGVKENPFLADHRVFGSIVVPGVVYLEMAYRAAAEVLQTERVTLEDVAYLQAMVVPEKAAHALQFVLAPAEGERSSFQIFSLAPERGDEAGFTQHATGRLRTALASDAAGSPSPVEQVRTRCRDELSHAQVYARMASLLRGDDQHWLGPTFQRLERVWRGDGEVLLQTLPPDASSERSSYRIHPVFLALDASFQFLQVIGGERAPDGSAGEPPPLFLPVGVERLTLHRLTETRLWSHIVLRDREGASADMITADARLYDEQGALVAEAMGLRVRRATRDAVVRSEMQRLRDWLCEIAWRDQSNNGEEPRHLAPDYLLDPREIETRLAKAMGPLQAREGLAAYDALLPPLDALCAAFVQQALGQLGWAPVAGEHVSAKDLAARLRIVPRHLRLFERLLEILSEEDILTRGEGSWSVRQTLDPRAAEARAKDLLAQHPELETEFALLIDCGRHLADVLRGTRDPLTLLFPEGSLARVERLYQEAPAARVFNTLVALSVKEALAGLPAGRKVRILEIGAGTGATTAYVLEQLGSERVEYVFTDVSTLFTAKAEQKFKTHAFMRYQVLDIERAPREQGFDAHAFDVIIAANVLHATGDLRRTLDHVRQLLAPSGLLVLLEGTGPQRPLDLIFGLTEGWWRFSDEALRSHHALLSTRRWRAVLEETGFEQVACVGGTEGTRGALAQQSVVMARQPRAVSGLVPVQQGSWLVWADTLGVGAGLCAGFEARGERCIRVVAGPGFERLDAFTYQIDPRRPEDARRLFAELEGTAHPLRGWVHLFSLDAPAEESLTPEGLQEALSLGCQSVLHGLQALGSVRLGAPPRLILVTRGAQSVAEDARPVAFAQSPLSGMGKVIRMEHPELRCTQVDLDPRMDLAEASRALVEELWSPDDEPLVAFRDGARRVARLTRGEVSASEVPTRFRGDATYLITGGFGGLGMQVAAWMVERGARHLALMSRQGAPASASDELARLARDGAQVTVLRGDVADRAQVAHALEEIARNMPPLRGVIHAAGVLDDATLSRQTWEQFSRVLAAKVSGAFHLHSLTAGLPLDLFVLFSSVASLLGSPGQGNHAAANAFLDALAHHRRARGSPALSINWGAWSDVGAAAERNVDEKMAFRGVERMSPRQGLLALERALHHPRAQLGVVPVQWAEFDAEHARARDPFLSELMTRAQAKTAPRLEIVGRLNQAAPDERQGLLLEYVQEQLVKILKLRPGNPLLPDQGFFEMGMDSLTAMELKNTLQSSLGLTLPSTLLFDYPTLGALTRYIAQQLLVPEPPASPPKVAPKVAPQLEAQPLQPALSGDQLITSVDDELDSMERWLTGETS